MAKVRFVTFEVPNTAGNFDVTGAFGGETPVAVLFIGTNHRPANEPGDTVHAELYVGAASSGTDHWAFASWSENDQASTNVRRVRDSGACLLVMNATLSLTTLWRATFVQFVPNGVRINFTDVHASANPARVAAVFFFDVQAKAGIASVTGGGVSGLAFQPNVLLGFTDHDVLTGGISGADFLGVSSGCAVDTGTLKQRAMSWAEADARAAGQPYIGFDAVFLAQQDATGTGLDWTLTVTGFTADGWTTSYTGSPGTDEYGYLALRATNTNFDLVEFQEPSATGGQSVGFGFQPTFALAAFGGDATANSTGGADASGYSFGLLDTGGQAYAAGGIQDAADPTVTRSDMRTGKFLSHYRQGAKAAEATASFAANGVDLSWSSVTGAQARGWMFAINDGTPAAPPILTGIHQLVIS